MNDAFYVARADIEKVEGTHRKAHVATGVTIELGVHGPVKSHYGLADEPDLPLAVDYVVAAAGG